MPRNMVKQRITYDLRSLLRFANVLHWDGQIHILCKSSRIKSERDAQKRICPEPPQGEQILTGFVGVVIC